MNNNKGMTLTELLVSIVMLSVAIVMMYGLMTNLQKKKNEVDAKTDGIIPVADAEYALQDFIMKPIGYGINGLSSVQVSVTKSSSTSTAKIIIKSTAGETYEHFIVGQGNHITYSQTGVDLSKEQTTWTFEGKNCNNIVNKEAGNTTKRSYLVITCSASEDITDIIKIPMYFSGLSGSVIQ